MTGTPYAVRLATGLRRPRQPVPGLDLAGTVVAVGAAVTRFGPGDEVYGIGAGTFAEYAVARRTSSRRSPPPSRSPGPLHPGLGDHRAPGRHRPGPGPARPARPGHRRLRWRRQPRRADRGRRRRRGHRGLQRRQGRPGPLARRDPGPGLPDRRLRDGTRYDAIIDIAGNASLSRLRRALTPQGTAVLVGGEDAGRLTGMGRQLRALVVSLFIGQRLTLRLPKESAADLERLSALVEAGDLTPTVGATYPLAETAEAMRLLVAGVRRQGRHLGRLLELVALAQRPRPAVGVVHHRYGGSASARASRRELRRLEPAQPAGRARADLRPPACQRVERGGGLGVRRRTSRPASTQSAITSSSVSSVDRPVEVLGGQGEPERRGAYVVPAAVDHDRGQLGVVGPRAAVEVVGADAWPRCRRRCRPWRARRPACPRGSRCRRPRPGRARPSVISRIARRAAEQLRRSG